MDNITQKNNTKEQSINDVCVENINDTKDQPIDDVYVANNSVNNKKPRRITFIITFVLMAVLSLLIINMVITRTVFIPVEVVGDSMNDTLADGDILYVVKNGNPKLGDVVIIDGEKENSFIIKRIVATSGDTVKLVDGDLLIKYAGAEDFTPIYDKGAKIPQGFIYYSTWLDENGYTLGYNEYFYLGDNRANSSDSLSSYKTCSREQIVGKAGDLLISMKDFTTFTIKANNTIRTLFVLTSRLG